MVSVTASAVLLSLMTISGQAVGGSPDRFNVGTPATAADIAAQDIDVSPDGRGLPKGSGSVAQGKSVYAKACASCHGLQGEGASASQLAGAKLVSPSAMAADAKVPRDIGNYWPYATTLFDYIRRAMPYDSPGSLSSDEVYATTAYLLHLNGLIDADARVDASTLPKIAMPALRYFRKDRREMGEEL